MRRIVHAYRHIAGAALACLFAGPISCGGESTNVLDNPPACTPGQVAACPCSQGGSGTQTCEEDGTYGPCDCPGTGGSGGGTGGSGGSTGGSGGGTGGSSGSSGGSGGGTGGSGGSPGCDSPDPDTDVDGDGWTASQGDCDECSADVNPGAYDFVGNGRDEDCSGAADDPVTRCDDGLPAVAFDEQVDAANAAKALGLCQTSEESESGPWGVISAGYVFVDGSSVSLQPDSLLGSCTGVGGVGNPPNPSSHGILPDFGPHLSPLAGERLLALSTGVARPGVNGDSPGGASMCTASATPYGFPRPTLAACPGVTFDVAQRANDPMALELRIRPPSNAKSFSFAFNFHSWEYPIYVCSEYFDTFVALVDVPNVGPDNNVVWTELGDPLSVNTQLMGVCTPGTNGGIDFACPLGAEALAGTGFEEHAATGWLRTTVPVVPGEPFTIRFAIWDAGDEVLDSTVLLDDFRWHEEALPVSTEREAP